MRSRILAFVCSRPGWRVAVRTALFALVAVLGGGCAGHSPALDISEVDCCGAPRADFTGYRLELHEMPGFLKPYVQDSLRAALNATGLAEEAAAPLVATVDFVRTAEASAAHVDDFEGHLEPGGGARFVAQLKLTLTDTRSGRRVLTGTLSRLHQVVPGDYMHEGRAREAMLVGFEAILRAFATGKK